MNESRDNNESFLIGQQTLYIPGQYRGIIMQHNKIKNEQAITNLNKSAS